jgi:large subunit ribosomal protein L21
MKYAIVESGGKQYKAVEGRTIDVDRLHVEVGKKLKLNDVLLISDEGKITVGTPTVSGAKVAVTVVEQFKAPKVIVFKYKSRQRYRVKQGHRQQYTRLLVESIDAKSTAKKAAKAEDKDEEKPKAKSKTKTKTAAKTKAKTKTKTKTKTKAAPKTKTKSAAKTKTKTKTAAKTKTKTKTSAKTKTTTKKADTKSTPETE